MKQNQLSFWIAFLLLAILVYPASGAWMVAEPVQETAKPTAQSKETRTWTDKSGKFSVEAKLLRVEEGKAILRKTDGDLIGVPLSRLSLDDQDFVKKWQKEQADDPFNENRLTETPTTPKTSDPQPNRDRPGTKPPVSLNVTGPKLEVDRSFKTNLAAETTKFIREKNVFGPTHKIVEDVSKNTTQAVADQSPFSAIFGGKLMKSGKATVIAGEGKDFFQVELTEEQTAQIPEFNLSLQILPKLRQAGFAKPVAKLTDATIHDADELDGDQEFSGSITYERLVDREGSYALRLLHMTDEGTITNYFNLGNNLEESGVIEFEFAKINKTIAHKGVLVFFAEIVSFVGENTRGDVVVVSNCRIIPAIVK